LLPVYLVLERDALISADLAASLRAMGPCRVIHAEDADGICPALKGETRLDAAFLEMTLTTFIERGLDRVLSALGARAIFTIGEDDEHTVRSRGFEMLIRPFSERMIWDSLKIDRGAA